MGSRLINKERGEYKKYSKTKIKNAMKKICANYATGLYTLSSVCDDAGVPERTFYHWVQQYKAFGEDVPEKWEYFAEFADMWAIAKDANDAVYREGLVAKAERGLEKRLNGHTYEETKTNIAKRVVDGQEVLVPIGMTKTTKHVQPSDSAIQFVLSRLKPDTYKDRVEHTNLNVSLDPHEGKSLEDIEKEIKALQNDQKGEIHKESKDSETRTT